MDDVYRKGIISIPDNVPYIQVSDSIEFNNGDNVKPYVEVSYRKVKKFIKSVMLHSLAPDWFDSTLRKYCKKIILNT